MGETFIIDDLPLGRLWRTWFRETPDSVIVTDADLSNNDGPRILAVNPASERISGYAAPDLVGARLGRAYRPESLKQVFAQLLEVVLGRQPPEIEVPLANGRNREIWLGIRTLGVFSQPGRPDFFIRIARDITPLKRAEQERAETERLFASVFSQVEQPLAVLDESRAFLMANPALTRLFGWNLPELLGSSLDSLLANPIGKAADMSQPVRVTRRAKAPLEARLISLNRERPEDRSFWLLAAPSNLDPAPLPAVEASRPAKSPLDDALRANVARAAESPTVVVAGKLQLIGLEEVEAAMGAAWPKMHDRAFAIAETILRRSLGAKDMVEPAAKGFLVYFGELDAAAAAMKARAISREIRTRLIGEYPELEAIRVQTQVARVSFRREEAERLPSLVPVLDQHLTAQGEDRAQTLHEVIDGGVNAADIRFEKVREAGGKIAPFFFARLPYVIEAKLDRYGSRHDYGWDAELDVLLMAATAERVMTNPPSRGSEVVLVPVHLDTLFHRPESEKWAKVARSLGEIGGRRMMPEIKDVPVQGAGERLGQLAVVCGAYFKSLAIELPEPDPRFLLELSAAFSVVTSPAERAFVGRAVSASFARSIRAAGQRNRKLIVKDIAAMGQSASLIDAGVTLLSGHAV